MKYNLYKMKSKAHPSFMYPLEEPRFIGKIVMPLEVGERVHLMSESDRFLTSPIIVLKETDMGYHVETTNSVYELRRVNADLHNY